MRKLRNICSIIFSTSINLLCLLHWKIIDLEPFAILIACLFPPQHTEDTNVTFRHPNGLERGKKVRNKKKKRHLPWISKKSCFMKCQFHAQIDCQREELHQNGQSKKLHLCLFQIQRVQACSSSIMVLQHSYLSLSAGEISLRTLW